MAATIEPHPQPVPELTAPERRVLEWASHGHTVDATARALAYSPSYVRVLRTAACRQLGVRNVAAAVAVALRLGIIR